MFIYCFNKRLNTDKPYGLPVKRRMLCTLKEVV